jgi:hypothetical protein
MFLSLFISFLDALNLEIASFTPQSQSFRCSIVWYAVKHLVRILANGACL